MRLRTSNEGIPVAASIPESILQRLKRETRVHHQQIEGVVDILRTDVARPHYVEYLATFFGYCVPLEQRLKAVGDVYRCVPDLERRWKASLLERDLRSLGLR